MEKLVELERKYDGLIDRMKHDFKGEIQRKANYEDLQRSLNDRAYNSDLKWTLESKANTREVDELKQAVSRLNYEIESKASSQELKSQVDFTKTSL